MNWLLELNKLWSPWAVPCQSALQVAHSVAAFTSVMLYTFLFHSVTAQGLHSTQCSFVLPLVLVILLMLVWRLKDEYRDRTLTQQLGRLSFAYISETFMMMGE